MQFPVPHALLDHALEFLLLRSRLFRPDFWNSFTRRNNPTASSSFATVPTPASNTTLFPTTSPNSTKSTYLSSVPSSSSLHLPASLLSPFDLSLLCIAPHVLQNPQSIPSPPPSNSASILSLLHRLSPSQKRFLTHQGRLLLLLLHRHSLHAPAHSGRCQTRSDRQSTRRESNPAETGHFPRKQHRATGVLGACGRVV